MASAAIVCKWKMQATLQIILHTVKKNGGVLLVPECRLLNWFAADNNYRVLSLFQNIVIR